MPYDLSACGLVTVCQLKVGGTGNTLSVGNDGGGVYMETEGNSGTRNIRIQNANAAFSEYSSLNVNGSEQYVRISTANNERLRVISNGNVGIGTGGPTTRLHVSDTSNFGNATFNARSDGGYLIFQEAGTTRAYLQWGLTIPGSAGGCALLLTNDESGGSLALQTRKADGSINACSLIVSNTGNIGIGNDSPAFKLHINTNVQQDGLIVENQCRNISCFKSTTEHSFMYIDSAHQCIYQPSIFFMRAGVTHTEIRVQRASSSDSLGNYVESEGLVGSTTNVPFSIQSCGVRRLFLGANGNVGINCITPSYRLHVNGTFYAAGSSCEYKTSICQYDTNSCMFMKLKPVTYQYKDQYKHLGKELKSETQIGLIAEEVAETYPELAILVKENDNDVVRNVDYEKLSIVLLAEVQKLRKEVDDLKTK